MMWYGSTTVVLLYWYRCAFQKWYSNIGQLEEYRTCDQEDAGF